jgi:hypothetical protein
MVPVTPKPRPQPAIERLLSETVGTASLAELPYFWQTTRITFIYKRPKDLEGGIRLPAAIRGALGEPLAQVSVERYGGDPQRPAPFPAFYADHFMYDERWHAPKPFVIWVREKEERIYVEFSLFGTAGRWKDDVIEAMLRIMLPVERGGQGGIRLSSGLSPRRIWEIEDIYWRSRGSYLPPAAKPAFVLTSITPFVFGGQEHLKASIKDLLFTIFARIAGLMRWQGVAPDKDLRFASLRTACEAIKSELVLPPRFVSTDRWSRTFSKKAKQEIGVHLSILVREYPEWLWPGIVLGTLTHAGYDVVQGYGRYALSDP